MIVYLIPNLTYGAEDPYRNLEVKRITLEDNFINYYILHKRNNPKIKSDSLMIYLPGSGLDCALGLKENGNWQDDSLFIKSLNKYFSLDFDILVSEKMDVTLGNEHNTDRKAISHYSLQECVSSAALVIDTFLRDNEYKNVYLIGVSEGAGILPKVYNSLKYKDKISKLVVLSGGGLSQYEEFKLLQKSNLPMPKEYKDGLAEVDSVMEKIKREPDSLEKNYLGLTFRRWSGFMSYRPLEDLVKINIPIFIMHGDKDTSAPVQSSRVVVEEFKRLGKTNLTYFEYKNGDHRFNGDFGIALSKVESWLVK